MNSWGIRYIGLASSLTALSIVSIVVTSGYFGASFNTAISFVPDDGWCNPAVEGIGTHCFGDYAVLDDALSGGSLWDPTQRLPTPYPPTAWAPVMFFMEIGDILGSYRVGLALYLLLMTLSLLTPAIWASWRQDKIKRLTVISLFGVATAPFIVVLDRGNQIGLTVAPVTLFMYGMLRQRYWLAVCGVVIASLLKPQLAILCLLLLLVRRPKEFVIAVGTTLFIIFGSFLTVSGGLSRITGWLRILKNYNGYQSLELGWPPNLSMARGLVVVTDLVRWSVQMDPTSRAGVIEWIQGSTQLLGIALLLLVTLASFVFLRNFNFAIALPMLCFVATIILIPGTSYAYYLCLLLPWLALLFKCEQREIDPVNSGTSRYMSFVAFGIVSTAVSPLLVGIRHIPILREISDLQVSALDGVEVGVLQLFTGPAILLLVLIYCPLLLKWGLKKNEREIDSAN